MTSTRSAKSAGTPAAVALPPSKEKDHLAAIAEGRDVDNHWRELWQAHAYSCFRVAKRILRCEDDAWAAVNAGWFKARAHFTPAIESFAAWIATVVKNQAIEYAAQRRRRAERETALQPWHHAAVRSHEGPENRAFEEEALRAIVHCQRLSVEEREAFLLRALGDYSYEEIGEIMERSVGTVSTYIHRARKKLQSLPSIVKLLLPIVLGILWWYVTGGV